jgi:hypothetical protein
MSLRCRGKPTGWRRRSALFKSAPIRTENDCKAKRVMQQSDCTERLAEESSLTAKQQNKGATDVSRRGRLC